MALLLILLKSCLSPSVPSVVLSLLKKIKLKKKIKHENHAMEMVVQAFNPSTLEAEAGRSLSSRSAWSTELVPGQDRQGYTEKHCQRKGKKESK